MLAFITVLGIVFIAEMGDKTQLVAMAFAAKYKASKVLAGVIISVALLNAIAVMLGSYITSIVPVNIIKLIAAFVFIVFGIFNLKEDDEEEKKRSFNLGIVATVALTFFIGELGDKTQLMTVTMAAQYGSPIAVFLGSTLGMVAADSLGIILGGTVFKKIPQKVIKIIASFIFIFFGTIGLGNSLPEGYITPFSIIIYLLSLVAASFVVYKYNIKKGKTIKQNSESQI